MGGGTISETHSGTQCFVTSESAADGTVEGYDIEIDTGSGFVSTGVLAASGTVNAVPPYSIRRAATVALSFAPLKSSMGINLGIISYSDPEIIYADVFKLGGGYNNSGGTGGTVHLDSDGWLASLNVGQIVDCAVLLGANGYYPTGTYKATWEGTGTLNWTSGVTSVTSTGSHSADIVVATTTTDGFRYQITSTDSGDPIRKIALFLPGCTPNTPVVTTNPATACQFNPEFLAKIENYAVIRSMDVFSTNNWPAFLGPADTPPYIPAPSPVWADRVNKQTRAMWGIPDTDTGGFPAAIPYEDFIELCNQLGAHPWLNIPASADTAFELEFAAMVDSNLDPTLRAYVEKANEPWNPSFQAFHRFYREGLARTPPETEAGVYAEYARQTGINFKSVLGTDRVTIMFAWQSVGVAGVQVGLDHNIELYGSHGFDAGATALYYTEDVRPGAELTHYNGMSQADAITEMFSTLSTTAYTVNGCSIPTAQAVYAQWKAVLTTYGIQELLGYENGNSTIARGGAEEDATINATMDAFSRDPRMKALTESYLDAWRNAGGEINCYFDNCAIYSKYGRWGSVERLDVLRADAPVYDGIQTWIEDNSMDLVPDVIEERTHGGSIARLQVSTEHKYGTPNRTRVWQRKLSGGSYSDLAEDGTSLRDSGLTLGATYVWRTKTTDLIGTEVTSNEITITMELAEIVPPTTGLLEHWKKGVGQTVATGVSSWIGAINSRDLVQATGSKQPLVQSDSSILFDGTDDYLQCALPSLPGTATFAIVGKQVSWTGGDAIVDAGNADQSFLMTQHTISPRIDAYAGGTTPSLWTDDWTIGTENILIMEWNGSSSTMRVSDGAVTVCTSGSPGTPSGSGITLGAEYNTAGTPLKFSNIQVKDILLYTGVLSAPDMAQLIRFGLLE